MSRAFVRLDDRLRPRPRESPWHPARSWRPTQPNLL